MTTDYERLTCERWGDPGLHVEDDYSLWPKTMNRLVAILTAEKFGVILGFEADAAIEKLYSEVFDGLNSAGCGYFWGYCECYRGIR